MFTCIFQPVVVLQLIRSTCVAALTSEAPRMHLGSALLTLYHSEGVGAMQGPSRRGVRWAPGGLNLHHPCPRPVPRPLNHPSSPRVQRNLSIYFRRQSRQIRLPALQAKHDLCECSFSLSVKIALWYSTDTFLIAYTVLSSVLGVRREFFDLTLKGRLTLYRAR